ncbi:alpha/beta fold hydrolase [Sphingomonas sp. MMS24-JH45]
MFAPLVQAGYRVLVPDLIGFGWSDKPEDMDYPLEMSAQMLRDFLDALGVEKAVLVGNSLGGAVSIGFALAHSERVEKLVLMATGGIETRERYFQMEGIQTMVSRFVGAGYDADTMGDILRLLAHDPAVVDPGWRRGLPTQPKAVLGRISVPDMTERLPELTMPILGFWGAEDKFCPASGSMKIATSCPDASVTIFSALRTWVMIQRAEEFNHDVIDLPPPQPSGLSSTTRFAAAVPWRR